MSKNQKRAVFTILMIIILNVATKLLGFVRDAAIGSTYAQIPELDTYFLSLTLTSFTYLSLGSAIVISTIPLIISTKDKDNRDEILSGVLTYLIAISVVGFIVYTTFTDVFVRIFASGFDDQLAAVTASNIKYLAITLLFITITYFNIALLQANGQFRIPALISVPYNLLILVFLMTFGSSYGITPLVIVTSIGWLLQLLFTVPTTLKVASFKFRPNFKNTDGLVYATLIGLIPIMFVYLTTQANISIANSFLTKFEGGSVSAYYYAQMLFTGIVTIIVYAISAVMFPKFNESINNDRALFFKDLSQVGQSVIVLMLPISICLILFSQPLVEIIFLRGDFTLDNAQLTANLLKILAIYMIAYGFLDVLNRGYFTLKDKKVPVIATAVILITSTTLNYVFINVLDLSVYYVAVSTVLSYYVGVAVSAIIFSRKYGNLGVKNILRSFAKAVVGAVCMVVVQYGLHMAFGAKLSEINNIYKIIVLGIEGLSVVAVYVIVLFLLKEKNLYEFIIRLKNKKSK